ASHHRNRSQGERRCRRSEQSTKPTKQSAQEKNRRRRRENSSTRKSARSVTVNMGRDPCNRTLPSAFPRLGARAEAFVPQGEEKPRHAPAGGPLTPIPPGNLNRK